MATLGRKDAQGKIGNRVLMYVLSSLFILIGSFTSYPLIWRNNNLGFVPRNVFTVSLISSLLVLMAVLLVPLLRHQRANWTQQIAISIWLFIGSFFLSCGLFFLLNGLLDTSTPVTHDVQVIEWKRIPERAGSSSLTVRVRDWKRAQDEIVLDFNGVRDKDVLPDASSIKVITKKGFLGYEWYIGLKPS